MMSIYKPYASLVDREDWDAVHALLDDVRAKAVTADEQGTEVYLRVTALRRQERFDEALDVFSDRGHLYRSRSLAQHDKARVLVKLGRIQDAIDALDNVPYEAEITSFPILAMDAKFFRCTLLAKMGDASAKDRLDEIPDDYLHVTMDGDLMRKPDIVALMSDG